MSQHELFLDAKKALRRAIRAGQVLTIEELAEQCGLRQIVVAAWTPGTPEHITLAAAMREVEQEQAAPVNLGGGTGWEPRL